MKSAWLGQNASGDLILCLHVQPGARKTEIVGLHGEVLKVRLAAAPVDGKANAALIAFMAEALGVTKRQVELLGGTASREKRLRISGASSEAVAAFLRRIG